VKKLTWLVAIPCSAWAFSIGAADPAGRSETTGSHLGSDTAKRTVVQLNEPTEIDSILRLLEEGKNQEAIAVARDYEERFRSATSADEPSLREGHYYALNALCIALTKGADIDGALAACTEAIAIFPNRWTAINSRGTTYFAARRFDEALVDYRRALEVAPDATPASETIAQNIRLTEQRIAAPD